MGKDKKNTTLLAEIDINVPLCVDLDGTLVTPDTTMTAFHKYHDGWKIARLLKVLYWLTRGRAYMKQQFAKYVTLTPDDWNIIPPTLDLIKSEKAAGRKIYLATATDIKFATAVIDDIDKDRALFDGILASHGEINYRAHAKAKLLQGTFRDTGFIYAGNSNDDYYVWSKGVVAVMVIDQSKPWAEKLIAKTIKKCGTAKVLRI